MRLVTATLGEKCWLLAMGNKVGDIADKESRFLGAGPGMWVNASGEHGENI